MIELFAFKLSFTSGLLPILTTEHEEEYNLPQHQHQPSSQPAAAGNAFLGTTTHTKRKNPLSNSPL